MKENIGMLCIEGESAKGKESRRQQTIYWKIESRKNVIPAEIFLICIFPDIMRTASINYHTDP